MQCSCLKLASQVKKLEERKISLKADLTSANERIAELSKKHQDALDRIEYLEAELEMCRAQIENRE